MRYLQEKLNAIMVSAAIATGCSVNIQWVKPLEDNYCGMVHNNTMALTYKEVSEGEGVQYPDNVRPFHGSTDMGNVSLVVPSIHPGFSLGRQVMIHTREFETMAGSEEAQKWTLIAAKAMALTCVRLFVDDEFSKNVKEEFLIE